MSEKRDKKTGLVVGRFQPFHKGHEYLIDISEKEYDNLLVGLGGPPELGPDNPLDYKERKEIIELGYNEEFSIFNIEDENHPPTWIDKVEEELGVEPEDREIITPITGNYRTADCFRWAGYEVEELDKEDLKQPEILSGNKIRQLAEEGKEVWKQRVPDFTIEALERMEIDLGNKIKDLREIEQDLNKYQVSLMTD